MSVHKISLGKIEARDATPYGSRTSVTKANFPILQGMALYQLLIEEGCFREPHWHPNADELGYCTAGYALITIFSSGNQHDQFSIREGEMFFVPSGSMHSIENIGNGRSVFILSFSSDSPEDFGLSGSVGCMSLEVMGNTWGQKAADLGKLTRSVDESGRLIRMHPFNSQRAPVFAKNGMACSSQPLAASVGRDILQSGGNAADAALAMAAMVNITEPRAHGAGPPRTL